jgi:hypothetical protein
MVTAGISGSRAVDTSTPVKAARTMNTEKKKRLIDQLNNETKQALMRLYIERRALHEFSKMVEARLEEGKMVIPIRHDSKAPDATITAFMAGSHQSARTGSVDRASR